MLNLHVNAPSHWFAAGALISTGALALALVSQHAYGMQPCAWCVLQRLLFAAVAAACALGLLWSSRTGRLSAAMLVLLTSAAGAAAALWQYFVAAQASTCGLTLADRIMTASHLGAWLPEVFQPSASCMDAVVWLGGIPYEFYSLALYPLLGVGALLLMREMWRPAFGLLADPAAWV